MVGGHAICKSQLSPICGQSPYCFLLLGAKTFLCYIYQLSPENGHFNLILTGSFSGYCLSSVIISCHIVRKIGGGEPSPHIVTLSVSTQKFNSLSQENWTDKRAPLRALFSFFEEKFFSWVSLCLPLFDKFLTPKH